MLNVSEMRRIILKRYAETENSDTSDVVEFNDKCGKTSREMYPAWKAEELRLFEEGKISHIKVHSTLSVAV